MTSIYDIKPAFQNLLRPVTRALFAAGVTANHLRRIQEDLELGGRSDATSDLVAIFRK